MLYAGIDVGTTATKVVLVDDFGRIVASASAPYEITMPRPTWAEQNPEDWWLASARAVRRVFEEQAAVRPADVAAVGVTGQMHGSVLLDGSLSVVRPALLWCDQRTVEQSAWIHRRIGLDRMIRLTWNPALSGFTAPKLLWVREHEPDRWARVRHLLLPKDYVRFRLTGELFTDVTDASGTALFAVGARDWSQEAVRVLDLPPRLLPSALESAEVAGHVSAVASAATGLPEGIPVVAGAGDQAAGAVGNGVVEPGPVSTSLGTSGVVFAVTQTPLRDELGRIHTFCHARPGTWHVMGVTLAAGLSFDWIRELVWPGREGAYAEMEEGATSVGPGAGGVYYLPYLMGERTPHLDPYARGTFAGLTSSHDRRHLVRAVMEGITFSLRDCLGVIQELGPCDHSHVRATGGGARSLFWRRLQADILRLPVVTVNHTEGPAFGAATLASIGAGRFATVDEAVRAWVRSGDRIEPDPEAVAVYDRLYRGYQDLYRVLRPWFAAQAAERDQAEKG